jgi:hypothetical protein
MNFIPLFGWPASISGNASAFTFSVLRSTFQQIRDYVKSQLTVATRFCSEELEEIEAAAKKMA